MSKRLLIVGTGGYAKEVAQIARRIDPAAKAWNVLSYVGISSDEKGRELRFGRVDYCDDEILSGNMTAECVIALGEPELRIRATSRYSQQTNLVFPNLIDPSVDLDRDLVAMGRGNVVHRHVLMTCDITMGDFNLFNKACLISHDVKIGSFNTIHPGATLLSGAQLGDGCLIGTGARVLPKLRVASQTKLGAGAVLLRDVVEPGQTLAGIPAKRLE